MKCGEARVVNLLARVRTGENFRMGDRHPIRFLRGVVVHAMKDALGELFR